MSSGALGGRTPGAREEAGRAGLGNSAGLRGGGASNENEMGLGQPASAGTIADVLAGRTVRDAVLDLPPPAFVTDQAAMLRSLPR